MARKSKFPEELTELMHSELSVSDDQDQKHATWTALDAIADGAMSKTEAMEEYGVTEKDIEKYQPEWDDLNDK